MKRLMLVRHGESEWNASRRLQGQADIALSDRGRSQARALQPTVASLVPDRVVASSLKRARDTAALLGFPDAELDDDLREIDVGDWAGKNIDDLIAQDWRAYKAWRAGKHTPPSGEAWASFTARTGRVIRSLLDGHHRQILVVSHGGVLRALLEHLLALPPERIVAVGPGSLTMLQQGSNSRTEMRLELFNFSPDGPMLDAPD
jgi:glucosyl-3-phosphoglycerate phosphatase